MKLQKNTMKSKLLDNLPTDRKKNVIRSIILGITEFKKFDCVKIVRIE